MNDKYTDTPNFVSSQENPNKKHKKIKIPDNTKFWKNVECCMQLSNGSQ